MKPGVTQVTGVLLPARPISVLLVDDDPSLRNLMSRVLSDGGCQVVEASDGATALGILQAPDLPDVVVTDLMMPAMSGLELIRELRADERTAELPVLVVSSALDTGRGAEVASLADAKLEKLAIRTGLMPTVTSLAVGAITIA